MFQPIQGRNSHLSRSILDPQTYSPISTGTSDLKLDKTQPKPKNQSQQTPAHLLNALKRPGDIVRSKVESNVQICEKTIVIHHLSMIQTVIHQGHQGHQGHANSSGVISEGRWQGPVWSSRRSSLVLSISKLEDIQNRQI